MTLSLIFLFSTILFLYHSLPWDQTSLFGYVGEIIYDIAIAVAYIIAISFIVFFIALCQHYHAFYQIYERLVRKLDNCNGIKEKNVRLCSAIRFHISVLKYTNDYLYQILCIKHNTYIGTYFRLFEGSADAFNLLILVQLIFAMFMMSVSVFQLDLVYLKITKF